MAVKKPHDLLGRAGELRAQILALGRDAGRAGVEVALAGHVAAERDERHRAEAELLGAQQRRDEQVAAGLEATVGAQHDAVAEAVAESTWCASARPSSQGSAGVLDRGQRAGAGAAGVAADHARSRRRALATPAAIVPTPSVATSFTPIARRRVDGAQVGDELREILDRVDVVVRRRADQRHARLAAAQRRDQRGDLARPAAGRPRRAWSPGRS